MQCEKCGAPMEETARFCSQCGSPSAAAGMVVPVINEELAQMAQGVLTRGIVGLALAQLPVAGIAVCKKAKALHDVYLEKGGANTGKARVGRMLANIGFPISIVMTAMWAWVLLIWGIWLLVMAGIIANEFGLF